MTPQMPSNFVAPSLPQRIPPLYQLSDFSTTAPQSARHKPYKKRRDGNPNRGVSALRRTGLRFPVGMQKTPLPQPVLDPKRRSKVQGDPNHGLWGFFNKDKTAMTKGEKESKHGKRKHQR